MKKRYIASPLLLLSIGVVWNVAWRSRTPIATAQDIQPYVAPVSSDSRHPIEVFQVSISEGETENDVLAQLPTTIYPEDKINFVLDPSLGLGTIVHVQRALPVTIQDGKKVMHVRTWANTVGELLDDMHRSLGDLDKANYSSKNTLAENMTIQITRVSKTTLAVKEVIPFKTIDQDDPNEYRGRDKVKEKGEDGERTKTYEITREDGEEVSRVLTKNEVTKAPKDKVVVHGTKLKIGKTFSGQATWYASSRTSVAFNKLPKGTELRVTNRTTGKSIIVKVDDTGAFGDPTIIDLNPSLFTQLGGTLGQGRMANVFVEQILP